MTHKLTALLALPLFSAGVFAASPDARIPFDGSAAIFGPDGKEIAQCTVSAPEYVDGVSGKALNAQTPVRLPEFPGFEKREGAVSFFFRPDWEMNDGRSHRLFEAGRFLSDFYLYFVKTKSGRLELSVCAPEQLQVIVDDVLNAKQWVHLAFSWSIPKGEAVIYINGKEAGRKTLESWKKADYVSDAPWNILLGTANAPADGAYDSLKLYNKQLSGDEVAADARAKSKK